MAARRLIVVMLVLLAASTVVAALAPPSGERDSGSTEPDTTTSPEPERPAERPTRSPVEETIGAGAERPARIQLDEGDRLVLMVKGVDDQVEIPGLGLLEDVTRVAPARFDLLANRPGTFAVRLVNADRVIGRIRVEPRRGQQPDRPEADPGSGRGRDRPRPSQGVLSPPEVAQLAHSSGTESLLRATIAT